MLGVVDIIWSTKWERWVSDFLSDEEQSERLRSWVGRYGLWVVLVIVLGISAYFFFEYSSEQRRIASENSTALLEQFLDAEDLSLIHI